MFSGSLSFFSNTFSWLLESASMIQIPTDPNKNVEEMIDEGPKV